MIRRNSISSRPVFLASATADYTAARAVLQHLTEADCRCFFCDEALLRSGDRGYQARVDRELAAAAALVVVAGHQDRVESEWVRYAWRRWCADHVRRGGGWRYGASQCRAANREISGTAADDTLGFRIAIVLEEAGP